MCQFDRLHDADVGNLVKQQWCLQMHFAFGGGSWRIAVILPDWVDFVSLLENSDNLIKRCLAYF
ncbi:hypothetical protein D3M96_12130 [Alcaligenes aquatilis]|uniref:Uncharacterized protein n=1 Tax=Alcaligenes aquatilis TaxID=323284 RepID=A0A3G2HVK8_9BURK|nr:hypothetical protein D3M96_12130 [Alcaligenes aquatilis]